ncbi:Os03g0371400, partial [Oryza sativa Japonica Group]
DDNGAPGDTEAVQPGALHPEEAHGGHHGGIPHALLSFSIGPRSCIGQGFAMLEAKAAMAAMLRRLSFRVSPGYVHAPVDLITLKPKFGLPVIVRLPDA